MKLLVIEDDDFKYDRICDLIKEVYPSAMIDRTDNVRDSVVYLKANEIDKLILDMSLPTHSIVSGEGSPQPMPMGGVEILFSIKRYYKNQLQVIIVTQYPDIELDGESIAIELAASAINEKYGICNVTCVLYNELKNDWIDKFITFLRKDI